MCSGGNPGPASLLAIQGQLSCPEPWDGLDQRHAAMIGMPAPPSAACVPPHRRHPSRGLLGLSADCCGEAQQSSGVTTLRGQCPVTVGSAYGPHELSHHVT